MISVERIQKKHDAIATSSAEFVRAVEPMNDDGRDSRVVEREQQPGRDAAKASLDRQPICGTENASSRLVSLTTRDRELFVHLAIARYLSTEQISELVFSGKSESIARRRLSRLVGGQHQYVRRFPIRTKDGGNATVWALKPLGFLAANNVFSSIPALPAHDPGPNFLEHDLLLNRLYVALASEARRRKLAFGRWPFRWIPSDFARLIWTELDGDGNASVDRLICPDATLELAHPKQRVFIEAETGSHTLGFHTQAKGGRNATKTKIDRYTRFMATPATADVKTTFYAQAFPDKWSAELLFVVPTTARRDAIVEYVTSSWHPANEGLPFAIRALTFDEAARAVCLMAGYTSAPTSAPTPQSVNTLSAAETRAIYDFYNASIAAIAAVRQFARGNPALASALPVPEYPSNHQIIKEICLRLGGGVR